MKSRTLTENFSELKEIFHRYLKAKLNLWRITLLENITRIFTYFFTSLVVIITIAIVLLFLAFAFTHWYAQSYGDIVMGYLIAAGAYLFIGVIVFVFRKQIFSNILLRHLASIFFQEEDLKDKNEEKSDENPVQP